MKKILLAVLLLFAGILIIKSINENLLSIKEHLIDLNWLMLAIAMAFFCGSLLLQGIYNLSLVIEYHERASNKILVLREYFVSQLVRYVPGKVWGIYYHSERLRHIIPPQVVWRANLVQFADVNLFSGFIIIAFLVSFFANYLLATLAFFLLLVIFYWAQKRRFMARLLVVITRRLNVDVPRVPLVILSTRRANLRLLILSLDWVCFVGAWVVFASTYMNWPDIIGLAVLYAGASLIGLAVFIVPSGLFVREASFIALATWFGYDEALATLLGIIARLLLTGSDVLMGLVFAMGSKKIS